ncbi:MAG: MmgE/PrpD family protein, partial [Proteobacteria bacterium]|nr:MmgE/PrpD family protein [Pseudomonadota bacterium]
NRMAATEQIAQFIAPTRYDTLPAGVVEAAKIGILDGVANLLAGSTQPLSERISQYVNSLGGAPTCSVIGRGFKTNAPSAAFANGVFLHCLDFEIQGQPPTHGTSAILPPALALAEQFGGSGQTLIEAYVIGWELQARLRRASRRADLRGFHPPGLFGPIGSAGASARTLGLDVAQTCMALGIAASHTGGLTANTGTMVKSTHPGGAARQGVEAALLAREGFLSRGGIFEAHEGYVEVLFGDAFDWNVLTDGLGETYALTTPGFNIKRYPAQIYMQWTIEAVITLCGQHDFTCDEVDSLEIEVPACRGERSDPQPESGLDGKFSLQYCAAVALAKRQVDLTSFSDATRFAPDVEAVLGNVQLKLNPDISSAIQETWA